MTQTLSPETGSSPPQHLQALQLANQTRLARSALKMRVAAGEITVPDVLRARPWEAETMAISDLLMAQYRWGRSSVRRFLAAIPMLETKTIGAMTERQRDLIIHRFEDPPA